MYTIQLEDTLKEFNPFWNIVMKNQTWYDGYDNVEHRLYLPSVCNPTLTHLYQCNNFCGKTGWANIEGHLFILNWWINFDEVNTQNIEK